MKVKNKFIIGVATFLSMGALLASPVKAGKDQDEAARLEMSIKEYRQLRDGAARLRMTGLAGIAEYRQLRDEAARLGMSVEEYRTARYEASRYAFRDVAEYRAAREAGFGPMTAETAREFREFRATLMLPVFQRFLTRTGMRANAEAYKQFLVECEWIQETVPIITADTARGFQEFLELPEFREFLAQRGLTPNADTYRAFIENRQKEQEATPAGE